MALAKEYERDGRVLILAPESLYGLNTLSKSFEGLNAVPRGLAAAEAHSLIPGKLRWRPYPSPASGSFPN